MSHLFNSEMLTCVAQGRKQRLQGLRKAELMKHLMVPEMFQKPSKALLRTFCNLLTDFVTSVAPFGIYYIKSTTL